jgi:HD-GYP domain-containing protein (c-di-GMP phosphodiesterase class II)
VSDQVLATAGVKRLTDDASERARARCEELLAELRPLLDAPSATAEQTLRAAVKELQGFGPEHACPELIECLFVITTYYYLSAQPTVAVASAKESVERARLCGDKRRLRRALSLLGGVCVTADNLHGATDALSEALQVARAVGDPGEEAPIWCNIGSVLESSAQYGEAIACFERAAQLAQGSTTPSLAQVEPNAYVNIAGLAVQLRAVKDGVRAARQAIARNEIPQSALDGLWRVAAESHYARLLLVGGDVNCAREHADAARRFATLWPSERADLYTAIANGLVEVHACQVDIGLTRLKAAVERARRFERNDRRDALSACIAGYEAAGQPDAALVYLHELLALNREGRAARLLAPFEALAAEIGSDGSADRHHDQLLTGKALDLAGRVDKCVADLVTAAVDNALRAGHDATRIFRVGRLAQVFALSLGWKEEAAGELALAVRLMDVGSVVVPDELLRKPRGLSAGERKLVAEHTGYGADLLRQARLALLQPCVPVSKFHHERWDGAGPWGLTGEAIPVEARIAALADALDALTHPRPWRAAKSLPAALRMISEQAGAQFDPALAERYVDFLRQEYWRHDEWEAHLAADAQDNAYIRTRERLVSLLRNPAE